MLAPRRAAFANSEYAVSRLLQRVYAGILSKALLSAAALRLSAVILFEVNFLNGYQLTTA